MTSGVNITAIVGNSVTTVDDGFDFFDVWNRSKVIPISGIGGRNPIYEAKSTNYHWWHEHEREPNFVSRKIDTPAENLALIAEFAPYYEVMHVASHRRATVPVLEAVLRNRSFDFEETIDICKRLANNRNTPAHIIEQMFPFTKNISQCAANTSIAKHKNTPAHILKEFLPVTSNKPYKYGHLERRKALSNPNLPPEDALLASQFLFGNEAERVWNLRFPHFVEQHKQLTDVDVSDWPKEWVLELVK